MNVLCEWGEPGIEALAETADVLVIVDVLSFSTTVDVAVSRGVAVYPAEITGNSAAERAAQLGALLAGPKRGPGFSLSPSSFLDAPPGARVVVPSLNGGTLSHRAADRCVFAGCLRNASAVARAVKTRGDTVGVVPAGERWPDGSLRPALEDWLGAGAIVAALAGAASSVSPEAEGAAAMFVAVGPRLRDLLGNCVSGRELTQDGLGDDVQLASELDVSDCAPELVEGAYRDSRR